MLVVEKARSSLRLFAGLDRFLRPRDQHVDFQSFLIFWVPYWAATEPLGVEPLIRIRDCRRLSKADMQALDTPSTFRLLHVHIQILSNKVVLSYRG